MSGTNMRNVSASIILLACGAGTVSIVSADQALNFSAGKITPSTAPQQVSGPFWNAGNMPSPQYWQNQRPPAPVAQRPYYPQQRPVAQRPYYPPQNYPQQRPMPNNGYYPAPGGSVPYGNQPYQPRYAGPPPNRNGWSNGPGNFSPFGGGSPFGSGGPFGGGSPFGNSGPFGSNGGGPFSWFGEGPKEAIANAWEDMIHTPAEMGDMPGGWSFPDVSMPNPVDVGDQFGLAGEEMAKEAPEFAREIPDMFNFRP